MSLLLLTLLVLNLAALAGLVAAARPRVSIDGGPFRLDERVVRRAKRDGTCPWRSMHSEVLCTRRGGHRGVHDVEPQPDSRLLQRA